jgi:L-ascorbate metabolism protein UlaG (beta-lactamase superfamily)
MKITTLRNATLLLEWETGPAPVALLVDPMLAARGALPRLRFAGGAGRRNPLVDLPAAAPELLGRTTHALITHCQRGHFDHLDSAGRRFLREHATPVFCAPGDAPWLAQRGLATVAIPAAGRQTFFGGHITAVPCVHGRGWIGRLMAHGVGWLLELPHEPSVYIAGDTLLTEEVSRVLSNDRPDIAILPAGGARFDIGSEILMDARDVCAAARLTDGIVIANHLEALDHCPGTRECVLRLADADGLGARVRAPQDGETLRYELSAGA